MDNGETAPGNGAKNELHELILQDITDREQWSSRQAVWYQMRHHGLRRRNKPFPGAADTHYPLCDGMIDKWKPFYFEQLFATETIASFVATDREHQGFTSELEHHFDYKLKEESNLPTALLVAIDKMLVGGVECVKVYWDAEANQLAFNALEPSKCIVPVHTKELQRADRFVYVDEISVPQYKANPLYRQDAEFVKRITGKGAAQQGGGETELNEVKQQREGITCATSDNLIVLWEVWERCCETTAPASPELTSNIEHRTSNVEGAEEENAQRSTLNGEEPQRGRRYWKVHTYSPLAPDEPVRAAFENPYNHGQLPFIRFDHEIKDEGHYESRGIPEIAGGFETALTKQWNEKLDYMAFVNRPMFYSEREIPNAGNIRMIPGQILGFPIQRVDMGAPPVSFDQEMINTRMIAEYRVGMPDFGTGQQLDTNQRKTATEVDKITSLLGAGVNLRAFMFRLPLGKMFQQAWELLLQFDPSTQYLRDGEMKQLPAEALANAYKVRPKGSPDSWNRQAKLQKAIMRKQLFANSPWINQAELDKTILELDDPKLVARVWMDPKQKAASEYEEEAKLIPTLLLGLPLAPKAGEDRVARIKCLVDFIEQRGAIGEMPTPVELHGLRGRIDGQLGALQQEQPQLAQQVQAELGMLFNANTNPEAPAAGSTSNAQRSTLNAQRSQAAAV